MERKKAIPLKKSQKDLLQYMEENNLTMRDIKDFNRMSKVNKPNYVKIGEETAEAIFANISCTHYGSKASNPEAMKEFAKIAKEEGAECIFHSGDLVDGNNVYKGHKFELKCISYKDQLNEALNQYPDILPTFLIGGNHDEDYLKSVGADIIEDFTSHRPDVTNLGWYNADIDYKGFNIMLQHGGGGQSYALSYKLQKYLEHMTKQPDVFAAGHWHTPITFNYRGSLAQGQSSFQGENLLSKRFGLGNNIGGWINHLKRRADGVIQSKTQYIDLTKFQK